jgi:hypothetical protein
LTVFFGLVAIEYAALAVIFGVAFLRGADFAFLAAFVALFAVFFALFAALRLVVMVRFSPVPRR